jgi:MFS family permease
MMATIDTASAPLDPPLSAGEFARLRWLTSRLPAAWTAGRRRRRLLFLGLAAPGFLCVFATPLHQNLAVLVMGFVLFGAACAFRARTERLFVRAEAEAVWPPLPPTFSREDQTHA